jgi:hypothetical protein
MYTFFIDCPHWSMILAHRSLRKSADGTTLDEFNAGNWVSYGGFSLMLQKNLHFGSGECALMFKGLSDAHLGRSVSSSVTPT